MKVLLVSINLCFFNEAAFFKEAVTIGLDEANNKPWSNIDTAVSLQWVLIISNVYLSPTQKQTVAD